MLYSTPKCLTNSHPLSALSLAQLLSHFNMSTTALLFLHLHLLDPSVSASNHPTPPHPLSPVFNHSHCLSAHSSSSPCSCSSSLCTAIIFLLTPSPRLTWPHSPPSPLSTSLAFHFHGVTRIDSSIWAHVPFSMADTCQTEEKLGSFFLHTPPNLEKSF